MATRSMIGNCWGLQSTEERNVSNYVVARQAIETQTRICLYLSIFSSFFAGVMVTLACQSSGVWGKLAVPAHVSVKGLGPRVWD